MEVTITLDDDYQDKVVDGVIEALDVDEPIKRAISDRIADSVDLEDVINTWLENNIDSGDAVDSYLNDNLDIQEAVNEYLSGEIDYDSIVATQVADHVTNKLNIASISKEDLENHVERVVNNRIDSFTSKLLTAYVELLTETTKKAIIASLPGGKELLASLQNQNQSVNNGA